MSMCIFCVLCICDVHVCELRYMFKYVRGQVQVLAFITYHLYDKFSLVIHCICQPGQPIFVFSKILLFLFPKSHIFLLKHEGTNICATLSFCFVFFYVDSQLRSPGLQEFNPLSHLLSNYYCFHRGSIFQNDSWVWSPYLGEILAFLTI